MNEDNDVSKDSIPNLLKIGAIPSSYGQMIHTDIIDPVTINDNRCRFTLDRVAGFLHSNSKITLAITPNTTTTAFYPLHIGINNLLSKATLSIGNEVVSSISDYSAFSQYQSMFISNEDNKEREQFISQRCINHQAIYDDRTANTTDKPPNCAKKIGLDVGRNPVVAAGGGAGTFELLPFMHNDATSAQSISEAPVYSVYLADLFPFLATNQIPCYLLNQSVHIDLEFTPATSSLKTGAALSRRMCVNNSENANSDVSYSINQNEVKMIYDSITYDGDIMEQYRKQNPKLVFQYVDYRLAKRTGDQTAFSNLTFPIGGNGRLVSKVIVGLGSNDNFTPVSLLNGVIGRDSAQAQELSLNLLYNDLFEFNVDRKNPALLFHTTQNAEGRVPMITRDEWKRAGVVALTSETFEGHAQNNAFAGLAGLFNLTAIKPNKTQRVNNKGMDLIYKNPGLGAETYTLRVYLELLKVAVIENNEFSCYFA